MSEHRERQIYVATPEIIHGSHYSGLLGSRLSSTLGKTNALKARVRRAAEPSAPVVYQPLADAARHVRRQLEGRRLSVERSTRVEGAVVLLQRLAAIDPDGYRWALTKLIANADASAQTRVTAWSDQFDQEAAHTTLGPALADSSVQHGRSLSGGNPPRQATTRDRSIRSGNARRRARRTP